MPNAPSLSLSVSRSPYRSRFTFRDLLSWRLLLRATWLLVGLLYLYFDLSAELVMRRTLNGVPKTAEQLVSDANWAAARFPFDPELRHMRRWVLLEVQKELNADSKPGPKGSDVRSEGR